MSTMLKIQENIPLAPLTTFHIGGAARFFCAVVSLGDVRDALTWAKKERVPYVVLSGCSNVLIPDEGIEALVIHIASKKWSVRGLILEAEAGCTLLDLVRATAVLKLGGWEKLAGIPGSIGGAVRGNAGAFGPEIKDFVCKVVALNAHTLETREFTQAECEFAYRTSFFKKRPEWIVCLVQVRLAQAEPTSALLSIEATIKERQKRHIQDVQAAGSYFVNPVVNEDIRRLFEKERNTISKEGRVPAGWLIEKAGMKGASFGHAVASEQHPNYLKNGGGATAKDVKALARRIKEAVKEKFGVELKEEAVVF